LGSIAVAGATLCLTAHDRDGTRILEIEPSSPLPQSTAEVFAQARKTAALFDRAFDQTELLQTAAREARRLTGFDRVMIYRANYDDAMASSIAGCYRLEAICRRH
jgi:two-component system, chemotaxis family, sensor kinase Cph1